MKKLINKSKKLLKSNKAESFAEVMVSILVFIIFMLAASSMLMAAERVTAKANYDGTTRQEQLNEIVIGNTTGTIQQLALKGTDIDVKIKVELIENGYTAFAPEKVVTP